MTWAQFVESVKTRLPADRHRIGSDFQATLTAWIRDGVSDLQDFIEPLKIGHETSYADDDLVPDNKAVVGALPESDVLLDVWVSSSTNTCFRVPAYQHPWDRRDELRCGSVRGGNTYIAIDQRASKFVLYPPPAEGMQLTISWSGKKNDFADSDVVPFDEKCAAAVALYCKAFISRVVDNDPNGYAQYMFGLGANPSVPLAGTYYYERRSLFLSANKRSNIAKISDYPWQTITRTPAHCFAVKTTTSEDIVEWVSFGDSGDPGSIQLTSMVEQLVRQIAPMFVVHLGDANYPLGAQLTLESNLRDYYDSYIASSKWYQVWGNHDLLTAGGSPAQKGRPLLDALPNIAALNGGKLYYRFVKGPVEFFIFNSAIDDSSDGEPDGITQFTTQGVWLRDALAASTAEWKIVCCHRPGRTSEVLYYPGSNVISSLPLKSWGAHMLMSGHGHNYERLLVDGFPYIVAGTGGAPLRGFSPTPATGSQIRYSEKCGVVRLQASKTELKAAFQNVDGDIVDSFTLRK